EVEQEAVTFAVLGQVADAVLVRARRVRYPHLTAVHGDGAAGDRVSTHDGARHLGAPCAHQTGEAEDLALAQLEGDIPQQVLGGQTGDTQHRLAPLAHVLRSHAGVDLPADHPGDHLGHRGLGGADRVDVPPVADHGDPVGDRAHLIHPVRDVDDGGVRGDEPTDQLVQTGHLGV